MKNALIGIVVFAVCIVGCAPPGPAGGLTSGQRQTDRGVFGQASAGESTAASGIPGGPPAVALYESKGEGMRGIIAAAWSDGTIVFVSRVDQPGGEMHIGRTDSARVARVVEGCVSEGFAKGTTAPGVVDGLHRSLGVLVRGSGPQSHGWVTQGARSQDTPEVVNACEHCAAQVISLIPYDGGKSLAADQVWMGLVDRFAHTGEWAGK